ncbi:MAG: ATP-binding protein, partial [Gammaproteobacteria bacterium]
IVVDGQGNLLNEASVPGTIVPNEPVPFEPSAWLGERILSHSGDGRSIMEYHAPLLVKGDLAGYVRLGFFKPGFGLSRGQLPFFATLALPIFLLTPLFYFLVKRETRPLRQVNHAIENLIERDNFQRVEVAATGELADFMHHFNGFVESARNRINELERQHVGLQTSTKLLTYKRERIETVLQSLPEGIILLDESGTINFANAKLTPLLGIKHEQVVGHNVGDWCDNSEILAFISKYKNSTGVSYSSNTMEFTPKHAPEKTIMMIAYPLFSSKDDSNALGTLIVFRDVTQETLAKRNRGEFVAHIAHELKTPLNVLAMYSEALQGEDGESKEFRIEAVNVIHDEVERLSSLINNLLSLTKFEMDSISITRQRVKLQDLLKDALDNVSRSGRDAGIEFQLEVPREITAVSVDKELLRIAINNLLTNAIKYNQPGGSVKLSAEETDSQILVRVRDSGIGIAAEEKQRIFQKFYRSDNEEVRKRTGHGLGLPLAKEIIELHHGELHVESWPGKGTEFTIVLNKEADLIKQANEL